ncbi:DUF4105 domain-containing protein [Leptospira perolatii]|nr:DUF4105 domain-containing protein [Leptospira perolatii]
MEFELQRNRRFSQYIPESSEQKEYLSTLIQEVEEKKLHLTTSWLRLLRYKKRLFSGYESESDSPIFFLSENGKFDPKAELEANLRAFFVSTPVGETEENPKCMFPERYKWLKEVLQLDESKIGAATCPRFETWKTAIYPKTISLVFSSYYMHAPASMFGHTFLKLNSGIESKSELLDYSVNYAANPNTSNPFLYAFLGLTGGYPGSFSVQPYYINIFEYNDMESRDLWEYKLDLKKEEIDRLVRHLWEMRRNYFDYFFLTENCSYHLIGLLEVAKPDLHLSEKLSWIVPPAETVKVFFEGGPAITQIYFRASLYTKIKEQIRELTDKEKSLFWDMIESADPNLLHLIDSKYHRKSLILESLITALRYKKSRSQLTDLENAFYQKILIDRSKITEDAKGPTEKILLPDTSPEKSHSLSRVSVGYGASSEGSFVDLKARISHHDLLNRDKGHVPNSEVQILDFTIRKYENAPPEIFAFHLVRLFALVPYNSISKDISYSIDLGMETVWIKSEKESNVTKTKASNLDFSVGYSFQNEFSKSKFLPVFVLMTGVKSQGSPELIRGHRTGPQINLLSILEFEPWKAVFSASYYYYLVSDNRNDYSVGLQIRYSVHKDHEIRAEIKTFQNYSESLLSYHLLF